MKYGIFDFAHYEMLHALSLIFDAEKNKIFFFVEIPMQKKLEEALNNPDLHISYFTKENDESINNYLMRCSTFINENKLDIFLVNSIDKNYKAFYSFLKKIKCIKILTIHNLNSWFYPFISFYPKFKYLAVKENNNPLNPLSFISHPQLFANYFFRKRILSQISAITVQTEFMEAYLKKNKLCNFPVLTIPYTFYKKQNTQKLKREDKQEKLQIAIPGSIEEKRRDYIMVLKVIEKLFTENFHFEVSLLGKPCGNYGKQIVDYVNSLNKQGYSIFHYYNSECYLDFESKMYSCDIILAPINTITNFEHIVEIYGETKAPAVIFDMFRFAKTGVMPSSLKKSYITEKESSIVTYSDSNNLYIILKQIIQNKEYFHSLMLNAYKNSEYYSLENIQKRIFPIVNTLLNKQLL